MRASLQFGFTPRTHRPPFHPVRVGDGGGSPSWSGINGAAPASLSPLDSHALMFLPRMVTSPARLLLRRGFLRGIG